MQINDPEAFNCTFCEKVFEDERNLKKHSMRIHNRNSMETDYVLAKNNRKNFVFLDESKASVRCKICEKVIGYKSLTSHMMLHSNIKRYGCEICEQKFARSDYLNNHMRQIHPNELRCDHCKLQLRSRLLLDQHLMTNHTEAYNIVNASQDTNEAQIVDIANVEIKAEPVSRDPSPTPQALLLDAPDNFIAASLSQACHQDSDYEDTEEDLSSKKKRAVSWNYLN